MSLVLRVPTSATARIGPEERYWTNSRWGDAKASQVTSTILKAERGEVGDWADLCEYAMATDGALASVYRGSIDRITQADWVLRPPRDSWDPALAMLAAEFVNQQISRIQRFKHALGLILHALGPGFSASEMHWRRANRQRVNYVERIEFIHPHRFRYDEVKQLRLWDQGRRRSEGSLAGEYLDPLKWIVHEHFEVAGYPGCSGIMKGDIYTWLFGRWVEKFRIAFLEKYGSPFTYAKVPPGTVEQVRDDILEGLENLTAEQAAVFDDNVSIENLEAVATSDDSYHQYLADKRELYALSWHGASDVAVQGSAGSNAAVEARISTNTDPRMVARGEALCETLRLTLFRALCEYNLHMFPEGTQIEDIPLPVMRLKTADDEVQRDDTQRAQEIQDDDAAAGGAQAKPTAEPAPDPKAQAPATGPSPQQSRTMTSSRAAATRRTSSRSASPFAKTLRRG